MHLRSAQTARVQARVVQSALRWALAQQIAGRSVLRALGLCVHWCILQRTCAMVHVRGLGAHNPGGAGAQHGGERPCSHSPRRFRRACSGRRPACGARNV
eukprot:10019081-Alexandrium_andersonii.AAC.1